jgi:hypothetical protein
MDEEADVPEALQGAALSVFRFFFSNHFLAA